MQSRRSTTELYPLLCLVGCFIDLLSVMFVDNGTSTFSLCVCVPCRVYSSFFNEALLCHNRGCSSAVERLLCMQKALGSKPSISTSFFLFVFMSHYLHKFLFMPHFSSNCLFFILLVSATLTGFHLGEGEGGGHSLPLGNFNPSK